MRCDDPRAILGDMSAKPYARYLYIQFEEQFGFSEELADYARSVIEMVALPPGQGGAGLSAEAGVEAL
jgi:hypothetical protein